MKQWIKRVVVALVVLGLAGGAAAWLLRWQEAPRVSYRTAPIARGDLLETISATGTIEPEEVIDVGAQVAGLILSFGKDAAGKTVDYGSAVEEGTVLARIDDSVYADQVAEAAAQLQSATAGVQRAEADLEQLKAKQVQAEADWARAQKLGPSEALAQATFDAYKAAYETAKANVGVGEASILQAKAAETQAQAVLQRAQRNLGYCTIASPVNGVIIDRRVSIGQTVVSSLNAPSLFLIAKDLKRMQVWVAVNEADIGKIHPGQPVTFTVDAFPGETFQGEVGKIRLNASMTQNVVTYTVEIVTDNSSGRLLPYLTANVRFELARRTNVLLAANGALRWTPTAAQVEPAPSPAAANPAAATEARAASERPASKPAREAGDETARGTLWVADGPYVRPVRVRTGLTDGINTEVEGKDLADGMEVVIGVQSQQASAQADVSNPFAPKLPRRGGSSSTSGTSGSRGGSGGGPPPP